MKAIFVKLPDALAHDLARRSRSSATSQSEIVRCALAAYLQPVSEPSTASCADRASRWIGMMEGPPDLSTNPEHQSGFGQ